jgi:L-ribulose-5-phosphate 3-epimerase UlaE
MELPNKLRAYVSINKITDYLLSETHAVGKSKAKFFRSFGFNEANISQFEKMLVDIAQTETVVEVTETIYGKKYVLDGQLKTPSGDMIRLRTVWIIETGDDIPRLVTAYPLD